MSRTPRCVECQAERVSVEVEWATQFYQINSYQCPRCRSVLRLVELRHATPTLH